MECTTCYCPHPQCTHYGKRGFNAHLGHCGADRGIPRLLCTRCQGTFSVRQGTAYFGVRAEEPHFTMTMRALARAPRGPSASCWRVWRSSSVKPDDVLGFLAHSSLLPRVAGGSDGSHKRPNMSK
jgi:hypothetical protein